MVDLRDLRSKVVYYTSLMTLSLNMRSTGSIGRVEQMMNDVGGDLRDIKRIVNGIAAVQMSQGHREGSILSAYSNDDRSAWREVRRELRHKHGFRDSDVRKHKSLVIEYLKELGDRGVFDDNLEKNEDLETDKDEARAEDEKREGEEVEEKEDEEGEEDEVQEVVADSPVKEGADVHQVQADIITSTTLMPATLVATEQVLQHEKFLEEPSTIARRVSPEHAIPAVTTNGSLSSKLGHVETPTQPAANTRITTSSVADNSFSTTDQKASAFKLSVRSDSHSNHLPDIPSQGSRVYRDQHETLGRASEAQANVGATENACVQIASDSTSGQGFHGDDERRAWIRHTESLKVIRELEKIFTQDYLPQIQAFLWAPPPMDEESDVERCRFLSDKILTEVLFKLAPIDIQGNYDRDIEAYAN